MRRASPATLAAALVFVLVTGIAALLTRSPGASGSALSRGGSGWLGARRVVESQGVATEILDRPLSRPGRSTADRAPGVLVVVFPWQHAWIGDSFAGIEEHLQDGGTLVYGFTGGLSNPEDVLARGLGIAREAARPKPPLNPWAWRRYSQEVWTLRAPAPELHTLAAPRVTAMRLLPTAPAGARVLLQNEAGQPVAFTFERAAGSVVVLPAELFANGRLGEAGNADWLVTLARSWPGTWMFDEYHHGLISAAAQTSSAEGRTETYMDLYLLQLLFLYALTVLALVRRFGPSWREPPVVSGSVAGFLVGLGGLHERWGHHREAAAAMVDRAGELDRRFRLGGGAAALDVSKPAGFLELARRVGRSQWRRNR
jgi:hypothetical protein